MPYEHPLVEEGKIEERAYQINIAKAASEESTLVVLPTGMGKTIIALLVMAEIKHKEPDKKILFLAPTKPLVNQHAGDIDELLKVDKPAIFTGEVKPDEREVLWEENEIIVSTPQVIRNDLMAQRIDLSDLSFLIFDEAHRAVGGYAYVFIGEKFQREGGLTLGLTASPGSEIDDMLDVCDTLGINNVEIRTKWDPDVVNYVQNLDKDWIHVKLSGKQKKIVAKLKKILKRNVKKLQKHGFLEGKNTKRVSRKDIIKAQKKVQAELHSDSNRSSLYSAASLAASAIKIDHAIDQAETQGPEILKEYLDKLKNEAESKGGSKASKRLMESDEMQDVLAMLKNMDEEHPKIPKTVEIVKEQFEKKPDSRVIVFTNYRNTAKKLNRVLSKENNIRPVRFVGQADKKGDKGLKQKDQIKAIDKFEEGEYNVLVATSVGEEGLDIPSTDLVVFYEPVPSEIRTIQRRGRTARERKGKVAIMITKKTRDEAYYWSSKNKEKKMNRNLKAMKEELEGKITVGSSMKKVESMDDEGDREKEDEDLKVVKKKSKKQLKREIQEEKQKEKTKDENQRSLSEFSGREEKDEKEGDDEQKDEVTIDSREQNSQVVTSLAKKDIKINTSQLSIGDYVVSENTAVERKSVGDFLESLTDGRLFSQAKSLSKEYNNPLMILEGEGLHNKRNISENAVYGALASLTTDFQIPVLQSKDEEETAALLRSLISREQKTGKSSVRKDKESMSTRDTKKFIIEGLPNISGTLAERLLDHFDSVKDVFNADEEELMEVKGIGPDTAERIKEILE